MERSAELMELAMITFATGCLPLVIGWYFCESAILHLGWYGF